MFGKFRIEKTSKYDTLIDRLTEEMNTYGPDSPEFQTFMNHLERVHRMKAESSRTSITPDTMAIVMGNLVGILIIVGYERGHVVTTRAKDFLLKTK